MWLMPLYNKFLRRVSCYLLGEMCRIIEALAIMTVKILLRILSTINDCVKLIWLLVLAYSWDIMVASTLMSKIRLISFLGSLIIAIQSRICHKVITIRQVSSHLVSLALGVHVIH